MPWSFFLRIDNFECGSMFDLELAIVETRGLNSELQSMKAIETRFFFADELLLETVANLRRGRHKATSRLARRELLAISDARSKVSALPASKATGARRDAGRSTEQSGSDRSKVAQQAGLAGHLSQEEFERSLQARDWHENGCKSRLILRQMHGDSTFSTPSALHSLLHMSRRLEQLESAAPQLPPSLLPPAPASEAGAGPKPLALLDYEGLFSLLEQVSLGEVDPPKVSLKLPATAQPSSENKDASSRDNASISSGSSHQTMSLLVRHKNYTDINLHTSILVHTYVLAHYEYNI